MLVVRNDHVNLCVDCAFEDSVIVRIGNHDVQHSGWHDNLGNPRHQPDRLLDAVVSHAKSNRRTSAISRIIAGEAKRS